MKSRVPFFIMSVHVEARALLFQVNVKQCGLRVFTQLKKPSQVIINLLTPTHSHAKSAAEDSVISC
jgi:hypothetical protein